MMDGTSYVGVAVSLFEMVIFARNRISAAVSRLLRFSSRSRRSSIVIGCSFSLRFTDSIQNAPVASKRMAGAVVLGVRR